MEHLSDRQAGLKRREASRHGKGGAGERRRRSDGDKCVSVCARIKVKGILARIDSCSMRPGI